MANLFDTNWIGLGNEVDAHVTEIDWASCEFIGADCIDEFGEIGG